MNLLILLFRCEKQQVTIKELQEKLERQGNSQITYVRIHICFPSHRRTLTLEAEHFNDNARLRSEYNSLLEERSKL